ncbi:hypothetical protein [Amycolatopsis sp. CFH S0078]|uniref:hypothetical protein n=1 Tax=Amycolatopsis sp. CFH S0078 TaxID=1644108 RepID=UPI001432239E|nr:hypothetical protein [Amycolatopsis sp. CFH S0078]
MSAPAVAPEQIEQPDTSAIRHARKLVDLALDHGNRREFHRHAAHLKALKAAARRRAGR